MTRRVRALISLPVTLAMCATASAATRYAVPSGGLAAGSCAAATPCTLTYAINAAANGDEVLVAAGDYNVGSEISSGASNLAIRGPASGAQAKVHLTNAAAAHALFFFGNDVTVERLSVDGSSTLGIVAVNGGATGAVFDRVQLRDATSFALIAGLNSTVRNSVLAATAGDALVMSGTLTGSTVLSDSMTSAIWVNTSYYTTAQLTVRNSIVRAAGATDISVADNDGAGAQSASLDIDYSAVRATGIMVSGPDASATVGTHNVGGALALGNPTLAADPHQLATAPTIDAGLPASAQGLDIDGDARTIGSAPDIGADEFVPAPAVTSTSVGSITPSGATVTALVNPNGAATTYYAQYGPTAAYGSTVAEVTIPAATSPQSVTIALTGLSASSAYHVRVVARNVTGTTNGPDATFTTSAPTAVPPAADTAAPVLGAPTLSGRVVRFSVSENATVAVTVDRLRTGRRARSRCRVANIKGPKCTVALHIGTLKTPATAGSAAELVLPATLAGRRLIGRHRLTIVATDAAGNTSAARRITVVLR